MSWADAQPAMASGAVDGQENPQSVFAAAKLYTVGQKYVTTWGYVADPLIFVVNKQIWESWTPADREIVKQAAIDAGKQEIALARKGLVMNRVEVAERDDSWARRGLEKRIAALGDGLDKLGIVFGVPPGSDVERLGLSEEARQGGPFGPLRRRLFWLPLGFRWTVPAVRPASAAALSRPPPRCRPAPICPRACLTSSPTWWSRPC